MSTPHDEYMDEALCFKGGEGAGMLSLNRSFLKLPVAVAF